MQTILQLNTSLSGAAGQSSQLAGSFAAALGRVSGARVTVRDLAKQPVPHLTLERFQAFGTPVAERTLEQQRYVAESDALVDEVKAAMSSPRIVDGRNLLDRSLLLRRGFEYDGIGRH